MVDSLLVDCRWDGAHGIARYARELLRFLPHRPVAVGGRPMSPIDPARLAWALRDASRDAVFFSPGYNAPLVARCRTVFTLHDLNHIDVAYNASASKTLYYNTVIRRACHAAAFVITASEFSRGRIAAWSGLDPCRIVNIGAGVADDFSPDGERVTRARPYFLAVSNRRPHKNEARLLVAFAASRACADADLVLTGAPSGELLELAERSRITDRVHYTGLVSDAELAALYRGAVALLFPSLYEGIGLPMVEAMASGTPVLTSTTTSLSEVSGGAALLVDPESVDAIVSGIDRLWQDSALRADLCVRGLERAQAFRWPQVGIRARRAFESIPGVALSGAMRTT